MFPCDLCEQIAEFQDKTPDCKNCWYYKNVVQKEEEKED